MNLDDFNSKLNNNKNHKNKDGFLSNFMKELQNIVEAFTKNSENLSSNSLSEDSICVVRDINDEKLSVVNIENGQEIDIYVASSQDKIEELHSKGIVDNIYQMSEEDLYSLNLGSNVTFKDGKCILYHGEIKIENSEADAKLEDMYFCLEQEKKATYSVCEISDEKIYLTDTEEGGYFSIPKGVYPDFKVGDLVKKVNGKYTLI